MNKKKQDFNSYCYFYYIGDPSGLCYCFSCHQGK